MTEPDPIVERDAFLAAMRRVAATVTVVTTDGPAGLAAATVSAFTSLSADPPAVLICLRADSKIAETVLANGAFCVNVLPEDAADLARAFACPPTDDPADRFRGLDIVGGAHGPLLPRATTFSCTLTEHVMHNTHAICIGAVRGLSLAEEKPLAYLGGAYHRVHPQEG